MTLKDVRKRNKLSQSAAASTVGMPLRTYVRYENDESYGDPLKRRSIFALLNDRYEITETKGILTIDDIRSGVGEVLSEFGDSVEFCFLFGSYAKGRAQETSDVDLCVSTKLSGFKFVGLSERLRGRLHKNVDLLRLSNLNDNMELINEIMKNGIKVFG